MAQRTAASMPLPEQPAGADRATLGRAAETLGVELSDSQAEALLAYLALLAKWNRVYNLSAVRDPAAMLVQHVADSLAVMAPLRGDRRPRRATLDVSSGAGLPGVVSPWRCPNSTSPASMRLARRRRSCAKWQGNSG
jgi:hypothetical protein